MSGRPRCFDIEVREPPAKHAITMMQVERWLEGLVEPERSGQESELKNLPVAR